MMSEQLKAALALGDSDLPIGEIIERLEHLAEQAPADEQAQFADLLSSPVYVEWQLRQSIKE